MVEIVRIKHYSSKKNDIIFHIIDQIRGLEALMGLRHAPL